MIYNKYIINPEDNVELASKLTPILNKFYTDIPCVRDNCGPINNELLCHLESYDIEAAMVAGFFIVDSLLILDSGDLYRSEKSFVKSTYGDLSNASIQRFVKSLSADEQGEFYQINHNFLLYQNLIIDGAFKMFEKYVDKIDASRYSYTPTRYISKVQ